jgi:hypothetical protein
VAVAAGSLYSSSNVVTGSDTGISPSWRGSTPVDCGVQRRPFRMRLASDGEIIDTSRLTTVSLNLL